jgi:hypothetical protein
MYVHNDVLKVARGKSGSRLFLAIWPATLGFSVTRWFFLKVPKMKPKHFCQNQYITTTLGKSSLKIWPTSVIFKTMSLRSNFPIHRYKFTQSGHPAWVYQDWAFSNCGKKVICRNNGWYPGAHMAQRHGSNLTHVYIKTKFNLIKYEIFSQM